MEQTQDTVRKLELLEKMAIRGIHLNVVHQVPNKIEEKKKIGQKKTQKIKKRVRKKRTKKSQITN